MWHSFYQNSFWAKGGGVIFYSAMSAIDIALWDIKGKVADQPIAKLLTSHPRERLSCYASHIEYGWGPFSRFVTHPRDLARLANKAIKQGYRAIKVDPILTRSAHFSDELSLNEEQVKDCTNRVAAIRCSIGGKAKLIIDTHANLTPHAAIQLAQHLSPYNIAYFEEPISPLDITGFKIIHKNTRIPLATGERLTINHSYQPFLRDKSIAILQLDLGNCGGITAALKIEALAKQQHCLLQLHVCGSPIATAAALQFESASQCFLIHEEHEINLKPDNYLSAKYHYQPYRGYYTLPSHPGIGQELSKLALANATITTIN
ncbi:mandelate racemase/muconate lactonizing enzyme family protein [Limosilactobacillus fastidiosus]|nr:mandelate racemase/muconate lactonizing enzyme family protein [Limosilactobacillus fastidiosus]MCD7085884.1 mandelate racemase/muconate lactonizing enzyme family protein [Limosilactobacillus fastidiosus]MCD7113961.1 mandelate racemase/muconate lactonizing enzyme family protein [Limosilactobacillus fastidiosus]MCD7115793.1 mandelate racemase/muconate lactonizing enzyme family protein [Limosilactobacillus fastidiosus]